jgi:hypothetical protein
MSNSEPTLVPSVPAEKAPVRTEAGRHPALADDIVVVCTTGLGVMALGGAALSIAHLLYLTAAPVSHYLDFAYLILIGTGIAAGFRARVAGLARRLFAICTGSSLLVPVLSHIGFGTLVGWELLLAATALGGTVIWVKRGKRLAANEAPMLEQGQHEAPRLPAAV